MQRELLPGRLVRQRMIGARPQSLTPHHLQPADLVEELLVVPDDGAVRFEQRDLVGEARGKLDLPASAPQLALAPVQTIVEQDEVADRFPFEIGLGVELGDVGVVEATARE